MALRPRRRPTSMISRNGSQVLAERLGGGSEIAGFSEKGLIKSVITSLSLAGFESSESVITSLAGFAGTALPQRPGERTAMPAAFRYTPIVSRRTPVA